MLIDAHAHLDHYSEDSLAAALEKKQVTLLTLDCEKIH